MTLDEYIAHLEKSPRDRGYIEALRIVGQKIPGLKALKYKYSPDIMLVSPDINQIADRVDFDIIDGKIFCWIYVLVAITEEEFPKTVKVYAEPAGFSIGAVNKRGFGVIPAKEWQEFLKERGISKIIISEIQDYFFSRQPVLF